MELCLCSSQVMGRSCVGTGRESSDCEGGGMDWVGSDLRLQRNSVKAISHSKMLLTPVLDNTVAWVNQQALQYLEKLPL